MVLIWGEVFELSPGGPPYALDRLALLLRYTCAHESAGFSFSRGGIGRDRSNPRRSAGLV